MEVSNSPDSSPQNNGIELRYFSSRGETPSEAVLNAVATASNRPVVPGTGEAESDALPSLYEAIDPDALDEFFDDSDDRQIDRSVTFQYCGYEVIIEDGTVTIESAE